MVRGRSSGCLPTLCAISRSTPATTPAISSEPTTSAIRNRPRKRAKRSETRAHGARSRLVVRPIPGTAGVTLRSVEPGLAAALIRVAAIAGGDAAVRRRAHAPRLGRGRRSGRGRGGSRDRPRGPPSTTSHPGSGPGSPPSSSATRWSGSTRDPSRGERSMVRRGCPTSPSCASRRSSRSAPRRTRCARALARRLVEQAPRLGPAARSSLTRDEYIAVRRAGCSSTSGPATATR